MDSPSRCQIPENSSQPRSADGIASYSGHSYPDTPSFNPSMPLRPEARTPQPNLRESIPIFYFDPPIVH